mgnify:CR=1 FL=1
MIVIRYPIFSFLVYAYIFGNGIRKSNILKVYVTLNKIVIAISQANREVGGKDKVSRSSIEFITKYIESLNKEIEFRDEKEGKLQV